jgi:hypothetical protein
MKYQPGDIVCFIGAKHWVSRLINRLQRSTGEQPTSCHHVAMVIDETNGIPVPRIVEAVGRVRVRRIKQNENTKIYRFRGLSETQRTCLRRRAWSWKGARYSYGKIALHFLDWVFGTYFFRRLAFMKNRPICSYLVARLFEECHIYIPWNSDTVQPDDMMDYFEDQRNGEITVT